MPGSSWVFRRFRLTAWTDGEVCAAAGPGGPPCVSARRWWRGGFGGAAKAPPIYQ